jgi:hypothetical protein
MDEWDVGVARVGADDEEGCVIGCYSDGWTVGWYRDVHCGGEWIASSGRSD